MQQCRDEGWSKWCWTNRLNLTRQDERYNTTHTLLLSCIAQNAILPFMLSFQGIKTKVWVSSIVEWNNLYIRFNSFFHGYNFMSDIPERDSARNCPGVNIVLWINLSTLKSIRSAPLPNDPLLFLLSRRHKCEVSDFWGSCYQKLKLFERTAACQG